MRYEYLKKLKNEDFRRKIGIKKNLFKKTVIIIKKEDKERQKRGGRKRKNKIEDLLTMAFEYWKEYRTYFEIGLEYDLSESQTMKTIVWIENILIKHKLFCIPGKKKLLIIEKRKLAIDTTDIIIQRPKKNKKNIIQEKISNIALNYNLLSI